MSVTRLSRKHIDTLFVLTMNSKSEQAFTSAELCKMTIALKRSETWRIPQDGDIYSYEDIQVRELGQSRAD